MATSLIHHPAKPPRIPAVTRILAQFDRPKLESFITVAISLLDIMDGDPDIEATDAEDEELSPRARASCSELPGCPASDMADTVWVERVDQTSKPLPNECWAAIGNAEDIEDDDPQGEITDDDPAFGKIDLRLANKTANGPGCSISDPGGCEHDGREPDTDAEPEAWSHPDDHPAELFRGKRSGWNDGPEAA